MDFLAQADVWSARVQEMRRNGEDLYVQENSLVSSDFPAFWFRCRPCLLPLMMIQVAAKCKVGAIAFLLLCGWWPARLVQHLPVSLPSISFCQVSTLLCTMPLCNYRKSWEDWLLICAELSGLVTPSLLRTLQASVASAAQFKSMRCLARIHHFGPRLLKKQRRFALESPLFFFGRVSSMCAHFDCALTQAWSTPLLEGLRSEVSTWNAQPAFEYRRGPQHFCLLGWIVWGRSHYTDVDMILKWFEHLWYWYCMFEIERNSDRLNLHCRGLATPMDSKVGGHFAFRTNVAIFCNSSEKIWKESGFDRRFLRSRFKQASFLLGIHHNRMLLQFTSLWPEMILQLETRGDKAYVTGYTEFMRIR